MGVVMSNVIVQETVEEKTADDTIAKKVSMNGDIDHGHGGHCHKGWR